MNNPTSDQSLRLFIAVDLPKNVVDEIRHIQKHFKQKDLFKGTYTHIDGAHITLKFLGSVKEGLVPDIDGALQKIQMPAMQASTSNLDVFVSGHMIRILFLNIVCPKLSELVKHVDTALEPWFEPESRPFVSHTTIARVKNVHHRDELLAEVNRFEVPQLNFLIDHFTLKQSVLSETGPMYTDIKKYALK